MELKRKEVQLIAPKESNTDPDEREFWATVELQDADGDYLRVKGIDLSRHDASPIKILNAHNSSFVATSENPTSVVGVSQAWEKTVRDVGGSKVPALKCRFKWDDKPLAVAIRKEFAKGTLDSFSVGFAPRAADYILEEKTGHIIGFDIKQSVLIEASATPLPANQWATIIKEAGRLTVGEDKTNEIFAEMAKLTKELQTIRKDLDRIVASSHASASYRAAPGVKNMSERYERASALLNTLESELT